MTSRHDTTESRRSLPPCLALVLLTAAWLSGCSSLARNPNESLLPPSWTSPTTVASAPPVVYEQATHPMQPRPSQSFPAPSAPLLFSQPGALPAPALPPPVPPADLEALPDPETQRMLDNLRLRIDELEQDLKSQEIDLQSARREAAAAREAANAVSSQMEAWRSELAQVRIALREQQASDLQLLDQVNDTLRQILGAAGGDSGFLPDAPGLPPDVASQPDARGGTRR